MESDPSARAPAATPRSFAALLATLVQRGRLAAAIAEPPTRDDPTRRADGLGLGLPTGLGSDPAWTERAIGAIYRKSLSPLAGPARSGEGQCPARPSGGDLPVPYGDLIAQAAQQFKLDPALVAGVVQVESGAAPDAVSPAGAKGLMQLMDATAQSLGVSDPFDPQQNITGGARLLRRLLDQYSGSVRLALAAYNAGSGAVDRYQGVPPYPETQRYVTQVLAAADRLGRSAAPRTTPR
jgi:soluble lytic murein transglycosylase-like protein